MFFKEFRSFFDCCKESQTDKNTEEEFSKVDRNQEQRKGQKTSMQVPRDSTKSIHSSYLKKSCDQRQSVQVIAQEKYYTASRKGSELPVEQKRFINHTNKP